MHPLRHLSPDLRPLAVPVSDLAPAPDNARRHSERDLPVLVESLRRFGQRKPIVAKRQYRGVENAVIAGNGTLQAATRLGWTHVAVVLGGHPPEHRTTSQPPKAKNHPYTP